jgi:hypothetical protein
MPMLRAGRRTGVLAKGFRPRDFRAINHIRGCAAGE